MFTNLLSNRTLRILSEPLLIPKKLFGVGRLINKYIGTLPLVKKLAIRNYIIYADEISYFKDKEVISTNGNSKIV